jgi:hypothetical protein
MSLFLLWCACANSKKISYFSRLKINHILTVNGCVFIALVMGANRKYAQFLEERKKK